MMEYTDAVIKQTQLSEQMKVLLRVTTLRWLSIVDTIKTYSV